MGLAVITDRQIVKARTFVRSSDDNRGSGNDPNGPFGTTYAKPRWSPPFWLELMELNTRFYRCADATARNAVGLGVTAIMCPEAKADFVGNRNKRMIAERDVKRLAALLKSPNLEGVPMEEVVYRVCLEFVGCGNGWLEPVEHSAEEGRAAGAPIVAFNHVPAAYVRVNSDQDTYLRNLNRSNAGSRSGSLGKIYFRRFGDTNPDHKYMNRQTGQFYATWPADIKVDLQATALIHFKNYAPLDDYYGQPLVAPAGHAVAGNKLQAMWNVNLLRNNAHIPFAIIVKNGNLHPDTQEAIEAFVNREGSGVANAGKVLLLQPDMSKLSPQGSPDIKLESLKQTLSDDGSFLQYKKENNDEIREAFGLSDILLGNGGGSTRATAQASKQTSMEQAIEPKTKFFEHMFNRLILKDWGSGNQYACVQFRRPTNLDPLQKATVIQKLKDSLSVNDIIRYASEILQDNTLKAVEDEFGDMPLVQAMAVLQQLALGGTQPEPLEEGSGRVVATTKQLDLNTPLSFRITKNGNIQVKTENGYEEIPHED